LCTQRQEHPQNTIDAHKSRSQVNLSLSQIVAQVFRPWLFSRWLWLWALGCGCCWRWSIPPLVSTAGTSRRVIKQRSANAIERLRWGLLAHIPSNLLRTRMHLRPKHPPTSFGSPHSSDVQPPLLAWLKRHVCAARCGSEFLCLNAAPAADVVEACGEVGCLRLSDWVRPADV